MYERFTDRARKAMRLAEEEARRLRYDAVCPEHVLLGLIKERHGHAGNVLRNLGVTLEDLQADVERVLPACDEDEVVGVIPLTPVVEQLIAYAWEEAGLLAHAYIGTEHLLLGLTRGNHGALLALRARDLSEEKIRAQVRIALGCDEAPGSSE